MLTKTKGSRAVTRVATLLSTLLLVAVGPLVATPTTATAAGLQCGTATLTEKVGDSATVTHSCVGSGTVQYKVDCRLSRDVHFSVAFSSPGKSFFKRIKCPTHGYPLAVYWDIK